MTSSEAGRSVANLLSTVAREGVVVVTRYGRPAAVVLSPEEYERFVPRAPVAREPDVNLDRLTAKFDALVARMQAPEAQATYSALFEASPSELGAAAVRHERANR